MSDHKHSDHCSTVKWGVPLAGAAIVAGAVLFAPALAPALAAVTSALGFAAGTTASASASVSTGAGAAAIASGAGTAIQSFITKAIATIAANSTVAGAALMGGGAAYFLTQDGSAEREHHDRHLARENRESFTMKEDMRVSQTKMMMQAAAAGNPQAQAMLANQHGLG